VPAVVSSEPAPPKAKRDWSVGKLKAYRGTKSRESIYEELWRSLGTGQRHLLETLFASEVHTLNPGGVTPVNPLPKS